MTTTTTDECIHGLGDPMWCALCRKNLGYRPGVDRQFSDCSVRTIVNLTGADYAEAVELLAAAGRRNGCGASETNVVDALAAAGWTARSTGSTLAAAVASGRSFFVAARRGRKGHAYAIVAGSILEAGQYASAGTSYRIYEVA